LSSKLDHENFKAILWKKQEEKRRSAGNFFQSSALSNEEFVRQATHMSPRRGLFHIEHDVCAEKDASCYLEAL
jgi:hypothetical protein